MSDISLVYDPRYHTFESWASLMVEAYSTQQLAIPDGDWKTWSASLYGNLFIYRYYRYLIHHAFV